MISLIQRASSKLSLFTCAAVAFSAGSACAQASQGFVSSTGGALHSNAAYSSSLVTADASGAAPAAVGVIMPPSPVRSGVRPFSDLAFAVKMGTAGIGFDVATPLAQRLNLRAGASFFSYNTTFTTDGLNIDGALKLGTAAASVDIYPFNNSFRISPGFAFRNNNHLNASLLVPGGQTFSLGESADFTSDPTDPIKGSGSFVFGNNFAPRLTMGFGNMLPRKGGHFSVPVEVGFQYISQPTVALTISGRSCVQAAGLTTPACGPVDQTYVQQEQSEIQADINPFRIFPVASIGLSYRIGRSAGVVR